MNDASFTNEGLLLALETSGDVCSIALLQGNRLLVEHTFRHGMHLSERLMSFVDRALTDVGGALRDVSAFAVGIGPGSFTGTRIGVMTAKTLATVLEKPLLGVGDLEAMAIPYLGIANIRVVPLLSCRANTVFCAAYRVDSDTPQMVMVPDARSIEDLLSELSSTGTEPILLCGAILDRYRDRLRDALPSTAQFGHTAFARAADIGLVAYRRLQQGYVDDSMTLVPVYISPPPITMPKDRRGLTTEVS